MENEVIEFVRRWFPATAAFACLVTLWVTEDFHVVQDVEVYSAQSERLQIPTAPETEDETLNAAWDEAVALNPDCPSPVQIPNRGENDKSGS